MIPGPVRMWPGPLPGRARAGPAGGAGAGNRDRTGPARLLAGLGTPAEPSHARSESEPGESEESRCDREELRKPRRGLKGTVSAAAVIEARPSEAYWAVIRLPVTPTGYARLVGLPPRGAAARRCQKLIDRQQLMIQSI
eukprot:688775-Hanusia_phi.AAC.1